MKPFINGGTMWDDGTKTRRISGDILYNLVHEYQILSPDYPLRSINVPTVDTRCNRKAKSVEQAFYACKSSSIRDRSLILTNDMSKMRDNVGMIETSFNWWVNRVPIMNEIVRSRFASDFHASRLLKSTDSAYIIPSGMGEYWGAREHNNCLVGSNYYGKILMDIRKDLLKIPYDIKVDVNSSQL